MRMEIFTEEVVRMNNNENFKVNRVAFDTSIKEGSGFCFNLGGTLEIFYHKTDSSHLGKFRAFYDAKRRRGTFQVTREW